MIKRIKSVSVVVTSVIIAATALLACNGKSEEVVELVHNEAVVENNSSARLQSELSESDKVVSSEISETFQKTNKAQPETINTRDEDIYVYVCGSVNNPDVYKLNYKARVCDALKAAGGSTNEAAIEYINLASGLRDGQKLYIPSLTEIEVALEQGKEISKAEVVVDSKIIGNSFIESNEEKNALKESKKESNPGLININKASVQELTSIPGIGESKANKIIKYRDENGGFTSVEDIMLISGIKEGMYNKIKDYICVD